jgi:hypothetical protein
MCADDQLPLWFASLAYVLLYALQRIALKTRDVGFRLGHGGKLCTRWRWIKVTISNQRCLSCTYNEIKNTREISNLVMPNN